LKKLLLALLFVCSNAWATDFQDIWWDSTKSGMGVIIGQQGPNVFVSWFTYSAGGSPIWYVFVAPLAVTASNALEGLEQQSTSGRIQQFNGTPPTNYNPSAVGATFVGTATLTFTSAIAASFSYSLNGAAGSMNLSRFNFATVPPDGSYNGGHLLTATACSNSGDNGTASDFVNFNVATSGASIAIAETYSSGLVCNYSGSYAQLGTKYFASGSFTCTNGLGGSWATNDLSLHDVYLTGQIGLSYTSGETCSVVVEVGLVNSTAQPAAKSVKRRSSLIQ
jgi:hypothetical protein